MEKSNEEFNQKLEKSMEKSNEEFQKLEKSMEKSNEEFNKKLEKSIEEAKKDTLKLKKSLDKSMGELSNKLGSIVEKIMIPDLPKKFKKLGYSFNQISTFIIAEGVYAQIDGLLENGKLAVAVEVKTTLRNEDIDDHLLRMEKIRQHATEKGDTRQFMGAMATIIASDSAKTYALKHGLFIIEPSGESVKVTKPATKPRVW
jgi:hypothetical protein